MKLYSQLNFGGNCEEAFKFYEKHLGGKITMMMHSSDLPPGAPTPPDVSVIHARLQVAGVELIGNDVPADRFQPIRSSYQYVETDSKEAAETLWAALIDGGTATIPFEETFFATRFGQLRDRFGVLWSILHMKPMGPR